MGAHFILIIKITIDLLFYECYNKCKEISFLCTQSPHLSFRRRYENEI